MTVKELVKRLGYKIVSGEEGLENQVTGAYTCDLLSHAMAKVNAGDLWITVHTNLNVVAVASLTDAACVLIPENIIIEEQTIQRANEKGIVFISASEGSAIICHEVLSLLEAGS